MPARQRAIWIPKYLSVIMRVKIHEARRHVHVGAINNLCCLAMVHSANLDNLTTCNCEVAPHSRCTATIENKAVLYDDVKTHTCLTLSDLI